MQIIDDLRETLLGLVLACHIAEVDTGRGLHIDLGVALTEGHSVLAARLLHELLAHITAKRQEQQQRHNGRQEEAQQRRHRLLYIAAERRAGGIQALRQARIVHDARAVDGLTALFRVIDLIVVDLDLFNLLRLDLAHERTVVDLLDAAAVQQRRYEQIEQRNDQKHDAVVIQQGLFR